MPCFSYTLADVLGVRPGTVRTHVEALLVILQVANRTEAGFALIESGVVADPESD